MLILMGLIFIQLDLTTDHNQQAGLGKYEVELFDCPSLQNYYLVYLL